MTEDFRKTHCNCVQLSLQSTLNNGSKVVENLISWKINVLLITLQSVEEHWTLLYRRISLFTCSLTLISRDCNKCSYCSVWPVRRGLMV